MCPAQKILTCRNLIEQLCFQLIKFHLLKAEASSRGSFLVVSGSPEKKRKVQLWSKWISQKGNQGCDTVPKVSHLKIEKLRRIWWWVKKVLCRPVLRNCKLFQHLLKERLNSNYDAESVPENERRAWESVGTALDIVFETGRLAKMRINIQHLVESEP